MALRYCFESPYVARTLAVCKRNDLAVVDTEGHEKAVREAVTIIKDTVLYMSVDTSTSNTDEFARDIVHNIINYNEADTTIAHASYSNGILSLDTAILNSSSGRWRSGQVYNYKFLKWT